MFLRKKGDITLQQVVLLVIAVLMILFVTGFGAKIWGAFFPSSDKSTMDSFKIFSSVLNAKSVSPLSYDMTPLTVYLGEDYCVIYFYGSDNKIINKEMVSSSAGVGGVSYGEQSLSYYKPSLCEGKQCVCLYDGRPKDGETNKDKNVASCEKIQNSVIVDDKNYQMKGILCSNSKTKYYPLIIVKRTDSTVKSGDNKRLSILIDDAERKDANAKLISDWKVQVCPSESKNLCNGKKDGEIVTFKTDAELGTLYNYCKAVKNKSYLSTSVQCTYDTINKYCSVDCGVGDVKGECGKTIKTCDDYNKILGVQNYISTDANTDTYQYYYMCTHDKDFCNLGCGLASWNYYIYNVDYSPDGSVENTRLYQDGTIDCKSKYLEFKGSKLGYYLESYNTTNKECVKYVESNFIKEKSTFLSCIQGKEKECEEYITKETSSSNSQCGIKYLKKGDFYWITYYNPSCDSDVKKNFEVAYKCSAAVVATPTK